ncbi:sulfite exporter TauE/SafE family protein [Embleya sp. NPDC005575]|uniref:urease accessory protein UreH domain-containing protein n=1 Tax=Embleya sp. NPDC005575 TaxID=3156892 RepID=UPI0033BC2540
MQVLTLFATGLGAGFVAGGASCAAVQGGLLAGAVRPCPTPAGDCATAPPRGLLPRALAAFLGAKLAAHAVLGALLGLLGAAIQPTPGTRAILLLLAGALMVLFGLSMLGVPGVGRLLPRASSRGTGRGPLLLGAATVLVPCGVTLGVELVAVTSGNAFGGAAVLTGFVLGTLPLFAALGLLVGASGRVLRGRPTALLGLLVLAVAAWTIASGLRLGGWWTPAAVGAVDHAAASTGADGVQRVTVRVENEGYHPARAPARAGVRTVLVLRTDHTTGCTRGFVLPARDVQRVLPATGETRIDLGIPRAGTLTWTCAMGMYSGRIEFRVDP